MTQTPNSAQPYIPPSAGSAPGSYNPQQYPPQAQQPAPYPPAQAAQPGQPAPAQFQQAAYPAASYAQPAAPKADSFMTNLFDGARDFASKYGKTIFIVGFVLSVAGWILGAINYTYFDFGEFLLRLLWTAPEVLVNILILRLIIEIAAKVGAPKTDTPAA
ncbi:MAG: hypothetical protein I3J03_09960 [Actinomyces succiniciruminis]|uniref:Uncharacterized protein n=1 Tax=Actinomyces succiniciruminis TaxID=1522002 RepID=A0A1L7R9P6_9ACTO|nr:hypothetical protein [Actinomyces succiniciruminis]MBE6475899.1 hypothetical protein [Actinomyces succiniciruminis]MBM6980022.1 hypothetical protein [Actinomyces succiniciruminis]CED90557.1 Hypothetical protein AAM4_0662 [Actinomyces succiniciruminis]